ncbi:MAG: lipoprotein [Bdellovibrio sp. ArHS]|uniref:alpha-2-macroglobulin family protein n=1 Tax=Bdellovibrio sp. ArHS TaxID=1569284 RepID=UPI0005829FB3|nr:MG2 domain-containing protein [Bdellovibrio sp. ArHS]KHD89048.1 MAG: lipoprotein [Bdellovibrio sp. ArHS]
MFGLLLASLVSTSFAQEKIQIKTVTPQGFVKSVDQVRIEFAQPMVRFGEIKLDFPAKSECFKDGQGRWVDTKNWVYDFKNPLPGGSACTVEVAGKSYQFNTGGPHVAEIFPRVYRSIDPQQSFVLMLDAPAQKESVASGAYFVVEGLGDRIPAEVVSDSEAEKIKSAAEDEYKYEKDSFKGDYIVIQASRNFPAGARVTLVWGKNIKSKAGYSSPEEETFEFTVAEAFKAQFSCDREAPGKPCIPLLGMSVTFTASIPAAEARKIYIETPDKKKISATSLEGTAEKERVGYLNFKGPFLPNSQYRLVLPADLKDEEGRVLSNKSQFPLSIKTGDDPSLLKFASDFGVIEAEQAVLPVTLRRVEKSVQTKFAGWTGQLSVAQFKEIIANLNKVQKEPTAENSLSLTGKAVMEKIQVQKPLKAAETEVVGIPLKKKGFYVVEMQSALLGQSLLDKKAPFFVRSAALVTNLAAHLKQGGDEAWVWVTELKNTKVVPQATVRIFDIQGNMVAESKTDSRGLAYFKFKKAFPTNQKYDLFYNEGFFAVAEKADDFTFTHSSWDRGIESWRFQLGYNVSSSPLIAHAVLDRTLFKPEETLSTKIVIRKQNTAGLSLPQEKEWPSTLLLSHDSGLQSFKLPLQWNKKNGTALVKWSIPGGIKMGRWTMIAEKESSALSLSVGEFSIESFRVPLLQVRLSSSQPQYVLESQIPLQISGTYFSGGPAADLPMKMRWSVEPDNFMPEDDELQDFSFANGSVKEGLFRSGEDEGARHIPQSGVFEFKLNQQGAIEVPIKNLKYGGGPQRLRTEVEYKDPNGEIQTALRSFGMWPSAVILGIKAKSWWATPNLVEFDVVALNLQQRPLKKQKVQVDLYTSQYYSHRKRLVGGFYAYEDFREFKKIGELCRGETNEKGLFSCVGKSKVSGSVLAVVSSKDVEGKQALANVNQWIVAPGENQWFGANDNDRADLIPFKKTYEPGETAEFQLRTPFPEAKVLLTVERDSVLYSEVIEVKGENPVIRLPIKKEYAPNVVVSAFAIRGRMNEPKPTALVDLGKPAFKLGMTNVKVGWKDSSLKVDVTTDRKSYKARDKAQVRVRVQDAYGKPAAHGEVALVAVDEGLLELRDNRSWDLLSAMMKMRAHSVQTATAQTFVIGKRHFGLKALPIGGDGGGALRRELFDTLLYWNPTVTLNAQGEAKVDISLNDSTTSFRIVAIAIQGENQFGTGWTSIQSSQDLIIMPGLSGVAREGDQFLAGFTVRNASAVNQEVQLNLRVHPLTGSFSEQKIKLLPGQSQEVHWSIKVPSATRLEYILTARNPQGKIVDEVKKNQQILPLRDPRVYQTEWGVWPEFAKISLQQPADADLEKSSILIEANAGLGGSFEGIKDFWKYYDYSCLEQQVSRAVSLNDKKLWQKIVSQMPTYLSDEGLLKFFPTSQARGSVVLTAYVLSVAHESGLSLGEEIEGRMLGALSGYAEGRIKEEEAFSRSDETLKKISSFEALSRYRRLNLDLLTSIDYQPNQWPLYTLVEWYQIHLWEKDIPQRVRKLADLENLLRSRFIFSSKRLQLKEEGRESMSWLMRDSEGAILRLILATLPSEGWKNDVPRLYQGALARQTGSAWLLTTDNAWGAVVMRKMHSVYSKEKVQGVFQAELEGKKAAHDWNKGSTGVLELPWRKKESELQWQQKGEGKPWITVSAKVSTPVTKALFAGFNVEKTVIAVEQKKKGVWSVGDVAKIQLKVKASAPQTWVVIEDPIPASSSLLQSSWATAVERKEELVRFYQAWFSGEETLEYTIRFNQPGTYKLPASRIEAMYSPDIFAELPESQWAVQE